MKDNLMDTQELSEIRKMIGEEPVKGDAPEAKSTKHGGYNLEDIVAEVSGVVDKTTREQTGRTAQARSQGTARLPRTDTGRVPRVSQNTGRVPHVTGRIPRIPGVDARAAEESLRASAEEKAKRLAEMTIEDEAEEPRNNRRARKRAEKERRRLQERERDDEDEVEIRDPRAAQRFCKKRAKNLARRSMIVLVFGLIATYITVAGGMGLPLPSMLRYTEHAYLTIMALMLLAFFAMFAGLDIVGDGLYNLFTLKPDRSSLVMCSLVASLFHGMTIILFRWGGWLPYCSVSILLLFAQMQEEKSRMAGRYRVYKAATLGSNPVGVYAHHDARDHVTRGVKYRMHNVGAFLREMERPDQIDQFERVYVPLAMLLSLVFALVSSIGVGKPTQFFWAFSAILSISAPIGLLCAFGAPYRNVSRKLLSEGAAIASANQAGALRRVREAVLRDSDLFPAGAITVDEVCNFGSYSPEKLLAYAAAVTGGQGLEIGRVLSESLREQYGRPVRAANATHYESGGMSADIGTDSVLVGTVPFLSKLGIRLPEDNELDNAVYVVINSQIAGKIVLTYHPTAQTYGAIHSLARLKIRPLIAAQDFNISPAMVESMFEMKRGTTNAADPARIAELNDPRYAVRDNVCAILSKDGAMPYTIVQHAADKLVSALRSNLLIGTIAGVCGMMLMFYLTFHGAAEAVEPKNVLLYLLLWSLPVAVVSLTTRRNY